MKNKFFCFLYANPSTMPDTEVSKDREFTFDCNDTVHCVKFSHLEFLTDLLAIGSTIRLTVARCTAKALLFVLLYQTYTQMWSIVIARWRFNIDLKPCPVLSVMLLTLNPNIMLRLWFAGFGIGVENGELALCFCYSLVPSIQCCKQCSATLCSVTSAMGVQ